jgi:hypothetical protein
MIIGDAGSYFGHTPGDVEDELNQLHNEIMQFGQEVRDQIFTHGTWNFLPGVTSQNPLYKYFLTVWEPFINGWLAFRGEKIDIPLQTLPLSGTWDRIQDYRKKLIDIRKIFMDLGFSVVGPDPLNPRKDPSLFDPAREIWKVVKVVILVVIVAIGLTIIIYGIPNLSVSKSVGSLARARGGRSL